MLARQTLLWHARHSVAPTLAQKVPIYYLQYFCRSLISFVLALYILGFPSLHKQYLWTVNVILQKKRIYSMRPATPDIVFAVFPPQILRLNFIFLSAHSLGFDLDKVQISFCLVRNVFSLSASAFVRLKTCSGQQQISNECNNGSGGPQFFWWSPTFTLVHQWRANVNSYLWPKTFHSQSTTPSLQLSVLSLDAFFHSTDKHSNCLGSILKIPQTKDFSFFFKHHRLRDQFIIVSITGETRMIDFCFGLPVTKCETWAKFANFPAGAQCSVS